MTLFELVVALAAGVLLLAVARGLFDQVRGVDHTLRAEVAAADIQFNGMRLARQMALNATVGSDSSAFFSGNPTLAMFPTRCDTPAGIALNCLATLAVRREAASTELVLTEPTTDASYTVASLLGDGRLLYLGRTADADVYEPEWDDRRHLPRAILFASVRDTVTLVVGSLQW